MTCHVICEIIEHLNEDWGGEIQHWIAEEEDRKKDINDIVTWRNRIAHGDDANTTGVTIASVRTKYQTVKKIIDKIEEMIGIDDDR